MPHSETVAGAAGADDNREMDSMLDGGQVKQQGTHQELLAEGGLYAKLWNRQQEAAQWQLV